MNEKILNLKAKSFYCPLCHEWIVKIGKELKFIWKHKKKTGKKL